MKESEEESELIRERAKQMFGDKLTRSAEVESIVDKIERLENENRSLALEVSRYQKRALWLGQSLMDAAMNLHDAMRYSQIPHVSAHAVDFDRCESEVCVKYRRILGGAQ